MNTKMPFSNRVAFLCSEIEEQALQQSKRLPDPEKPRIIAALADSMLPEGWKYAVGQASSGRCFIIITGIDS